MRERKRLEKDKIDKRLIYPIDELRVKFWLSQVKQASGYKTEYALAKAFGGTQAKWKNYVNGGQPNELVLDEVAEKISDSKNWYICGPNGLKLWSSLSSEATIIELGLISEFSQNVDGKIAKFRIDSINREICNPDMYPNTISEAFQLKSDEIQIMLAKVLDKSFLKDAIAILNLLIEQHIEYELNKFNDNLMDFIMDSRYKKADEVKMLRELEYEELGLSTIMKKGQRKNTI